MEVHTNPVRATLPEIDLTVTKLSRWADADVVVRQDQTLLWGRVVDVKGDEFVVQPEKGQPFAVSEALLTTVPAYLKALGGSNIIVTARVIDEDEDEDCTFAIQLPSSCTVLAVRWAVAQHHRQSSTQGNPGAQGSPESLQTALQDLSHTVVRPCHVGLTFEEQELQDNDSIDELGIRNDDTIFVHIRGLEHPKMLHLNI